METTVEMKKPANVIRFASYRRSIREIIATVIDKITENNIELNLDQNILWLLLEEAIVNAMEHGNKWDTSKFVTVNVKENLSYLTISVHDEGDGFDTNVSRSNNSFRLRGKGIPILKTFCIPLWNKKGNIVHLNILRPKGIHTD